VLETSLAYFINPLLNVAVGVLFFKEPFPWPMRLAVGLAAAGVLVLASFAPEFPWIALTLATTFCTYGVVKKVIGVEPRLGSLLEGAAGLIPALIAAYCLREGSPVELTAVHWAFLVGAGVVTGLPLFLFSIAAQQLPYSLVGMLQFIAPTLQFLVGVWMYHEPLSGVRLLAFILIWLGVGFYLGDRVTRLTAAAHRRRHGR
jgi:chloramphenicol-sensitive protein RarD